MFRCLFHTRLFAAAAGAVTSVQPPTAVAALHTAVHPLCAGHSKWANIRHIKAAKDGQRSLLFVKLARQIRCAIQDGGSATPSANTQLRQAIDEATKRDMPNHTIQGILRKASQSPAKLKRHVIEARVLNKVFMVLVLYTDKYAGDRMQLATLFRKGGAVAMDIRHMFEEKGFVEAQLTVPALAADAAGAAADATEGVASLTEEQLVERCTEDAIECGAEEMDVLDVAQRRILFVCDPDELERLRQKLTATGNYTIDSIEHAYIPNSYAQLTDAEAASYRYLREKLKAFEGVEDIYDNLPELEDTTVEQRRKQ